MLRKRVALGLILLLMGPSRWSHPQDSLANDPLSTPKNPKTDVKVKHVEMSYRSRDVDKIVRGELVAQQPGFGYLILDPDGELISIEPEEFVAMTEQSEPMVPTPAKELGIKLLREMPDQSKFFTTDNYLVCYNTTETYARWNATLFEQRLKGFYKFWASRGLKLDKPRFPLVALIFESKEDYVAYASKEFRGSEGTFGYYHQARNRLASYDLTGVEGVLPPGVKVNRDALLSTILSRPEAERTVSTIIHEATHQLAFNCGLQTRLGDNPLWLSEGIATFFETPAGIGKLNGFNYSNLIQSLPHRTPDSLQRLLIDDNLLRNEESMMRGYAEAWGLFHFLVQTNPKGMVKYLETIRSTPIGFPSSAKERLDLFRNCFGEDLEKLEANFLKYIRKIR